MSIHKVQNMTKWQINRLNIVLEYKEKGYSYKRIGTIMGLSPQRVHEIHKSYSRGLEK